MKSAYNLKNDSARHFDEGEISQLFNLFQFMEMSRFLDMTFSVYTSFIKIHNL